MPRRVVSPSARERVEAAPAGRRRRLLRLPSGARAQPTLLAPRHLLAGGVRRLLRLLLRLHELRLQRLDARLRSRSREQGGAAWRRQRGQRVGPHPPARRALPQCRQGHASQLSPTNPPLVTCSMSLSPHSPTPSSSPAACPSLSRGPCWTTSACGTWPPGRPPCGTARCPRSCVGVGVLVQGTQSAVGALPPSTRVAARVTCPLQHSRQPISTASAAPGVPEASIGCA